MGANSTEKYKQTSMGIVLKRRDNAPIVKVIYGGIIDILMKDQDIPKSVNFTRSILEDIDILSTLTKTELVELILSNQIAVKKVILQEKKAVNDQERIDFYYSIPPFS